MAEITITAKIQIHPSEADRQSLTETMSAYRRACDFVSGHVFVTHDLSQPSLNRVLYYQIRDRFGLKAQAAQSVIKTVIARYKTVMSQGNGWMRPSFRKPQLDLVWNRDYSLKKNLFSVSSSTGRLQVPYSFAGMERYFDPEVYAFGTASLVFKHKKFFLHIPVTYEVPDCSMNDIKCVVGVDRGVNFTTATYDSCGKSGFISGRAAKQKRAHYKAVRKSLQERGTASSRRRLKSIGERENRWMQDVNHCVSKALVSKYPSHTMFVLEDLTGIRAATERVKRKDRYVLVSWAFYDLEQKLVYKAKQKGSIVVKVNPRYTSQSCPKCGHTEKANRNRRFHSFCCKNCGYRSNDDRIAAMNLYRKGINLLSEQPVPGTVTTE